MHKQQTYKRYGFTLVELMVVIAIISILAVGSVTGYQSYVEKAQESKQLQELVRGIADAKIARLDIGRNASQEQMNIEMDVIAQTISLARDYEEKTLIQIIPGSCSDCACRGDNLINITGGAQSCINDWNTIIDILADNTKGVDLSFLRTDPWGSPYLIDQNEGEVQNGDSCRVDYIFSAGPDGIHASNPGASTIGDGFRKAIPYYSQGDCI